MIWDTAGQEKYRCLVSSFLRDSHGALLVFDLTSKETFEGMKNIWLELLNKNDLENICKVVLANKCDKIGEIQVLDQDILDFEEKYQIKCFKTSAKDNIGIEESFAYLAKNMSKIFPFATCETKTPNGLDPTFGIEVSKVINKTKTKGIKCEKDKNFDSSMTSCCK